MSIRGNFGGESPGRLDNINTYFLKFALLHTSSSPTVMMDDIQYRKLLKQPDIQLEITPGDLPQNLLPTVGDVLGRVLKVSLEEMRGGNVQEKSVPIYQMLRSSGGQRGS